MNINLLLNPAPAVPPHPAQPVQAVQSNWIPCNSTVRRLRWDKKTCRFCGLALLTGERDGFCCGPKGSKIANIPPLPPPPHEYADLISDPNISFKSWQLNLVYSFAALESDMPFPVIHGPQGFVAMQGRIYHRIQPEHANSGVRWLLYDGYRPDAIPHSEYRLPGCWIRVLTAALCHVNPFVSTLQNLRGLDPEELPEAHIVLHDKGPTAEIAAILRYDNTIAADVTPRQLIVKRNERAVSILTVSCLWEPLSYPLLFPHGTLGWGVTGSFDEQGNIDDVDRPTTQMWHYRIRLLHEPRFQIFGRVTNEYVVDMWTRALETRLYYIRTNQQRIRREDAELMAEDDVESNENIYLPASFLGSNSWCSEQISDGLAVATTLGHPTFFLTATCNPDWEEIASQLRAGQTWRDAPVLVARVFKQKLHQIMEYVKHLWPGAGRLLYCISVIEFQKHGLPHAHVLLKFEHDCITPHDVDAVVSAEMPTDAADAGLVKFHMKHSHPQRYDPNHPPACYRTNAHGELYCQYRYPHPLQSETTTDNEGRVHYRRRREGDQWVVPHSLSLLRKFHCHINVEIAGTSQLFQYLFKYIHKGPDRARFRMLQDRNEPIDEIDEFWKGRYLSAGEAVWRILGYHIARKTPSVTSLPIHLPDSTAHHQYHRRGAVHSMVSLLDRYFLRPRADDILSSPTDCLTRSILAPTNIQVDRYNRIILHRIEGEQRSYFATNSMKEMNAVDAVPTEDAVDYMASFNMPGIPAHQLDIKVNGVYRLIRNLSIDRNLVKNTRVLITGLGQKIITVRRLARAPDGRSFVDGEDILIPRITFEQKIRGLGFTLLRKQFPLAPAYATTFNSCQGLTLDCVGIDLRRAVFSHGQLYTAVSRVRRANALRIRLPPDNSTALNVTYHELLL